MCKPITNIHRIEGDGGVSVEIVGRGGICYREGSREMLIDSEFLVIGGRYDLVLYSGSAHRWNPPYADEIISDEKRKQIVSNVYELLISHGLRVDLD